MAPAVVTLVGLAQQSQDLGLVALDLVQMLVGAAVAADPALAKPSPAEASEGPK